MPSSMQLQMYYDDKNKHFPSPPPPESQNKMTPQQSHNDKPFGGFLGAVYDRYDHNKNDFLVTSILNLYFYWDSCYHCYKALL